MKKILVRSFLAILALSLLLSMVGYAVFRNSLPQLDGEIAVNGLRADVSISRDSNGVPTIVAGNRADLAYATGFVHGQDRFFQMDLTRRKAAGELSEIVGAATLDIDRRSRLHRFRYRADRVLEQLPDHDKAILSAYAIGVNAGLASLDAKLFEYYLLGVEPRPWEMSDSLLAVYSMFFELNDETAYRDIGRGVARGALPAAAFSWLFPRGTQWDAPLTGEVDQPQRMPGPREYSLDSQSMPAVASAAQRWRDLPAPGSNNWAVAGSLTANGRAIVANDMHLGITVPNVFYRARMRVSGASEIDLIGLTLPGAPILVAGSNGHIAWANTNSNGDWSDAVIVVDGDRPGTYVTPAGQKSIAKISETILIKDQQPETLEISETVWGPILESSDDPTRRFAVSWIAHHVEGVSLDHLRLEAVTNVAQALAVANTIGMPPQNFVVGDAEGNIGWTIAGRIPARRAGDSQIPIDWSIAEGWSGWLPPNQYPRIINPDSGRIWTANSRVVNGELPHSITNGDYALGARGQQIRDALFALDRFTPEDMLSVQLDDRAIFLTRWRELLLQTLNTDVVDGNSERARVRQFVERWDARASQGSVGYRLVDAFRTEVGERVISMVMLPVLEKNGADTELLISKHFEQPLWTLVSVKPAHLLTSDYSSWNDLLLRSIDAQIEYLTRNYTDGLENRTWGEINTAAIRHPLSPSVPLLGHLLDMPAVPLAGDTNMPRVQSPGFGASERFAVSPGDEKSGFLHMPSGQSGHPLSGFYSAGHDDWVAGRPSQFLPGEAAHLLTLKAVP